MAKNKMRRGEPPIRQSGVGAQATKPLESTRPTRIDATIAEIYPNMSGGIARINLPTGDYTYRAIPFYITSSAEIVGKTTEVVGIGHVVNTANVSEYISNVRLMMNGAVMQELTTDELVIRNQYSVLDMSAGMVGFWFPGTRFYQDARHRDAFALGTERAYGLKLELQQTAAFDTGTMELHCAPLFVRAPKATAFTYTTERISNTFSAIGKHTFTDLPDGDAIAQIWMIADGVTHLKMEVDGKTLIDCNRIEYNNMLIEAGRDISAIGDDWLIDMHWDGRPRSLAPLDLPAEVRRGAKIKVELTTTQANTEVQFLVLHSGLYRDVR